MGSLDRAVGIGWGKIALLGEHAVCYGGSALLLPLPAGVQAVVRDKKGGGKKRRDLKIAVSQLQSSRAASLKAAGVVRTICNEWGFSPDGLEVEIHSDLPAECGLGSSAALCAALVRALGKHFGISLGNRAVFDTARSAEHFFHSSSSGMDCAAAVYSMPLLYLPGNPPEVRTLPEISLPVLIVADTGMRRKTADVVSDISRRIIRRADLSAIIQSIAKLADRALPLLARSDYSSFGRLLNEGHGLLRHLGVSTPQLDMLAEELRRAGACGAKLSGAGGGGAVIAACSSFSQAQKVQARIARQGIPATLIAWDRFK